MNAHQISHNTRFEPIDPMYAYKTARAEQSRQIARGLRAIGGMFSRFVEAWKTHRANAAVIRELESYTDRQLNDLGISRSGIKDAVLNGVRHPQDDLQPVTVEIGGTMLAANVNHAPVRRVA